ncbi:MAG: FecR domain-containing protein [Candidatus Omnitrophica bacterium]|nr:FecR domain-containing protein [Candidatus Omnitrophota bacterium]
MSGELSLRQEEALARLRRLEVQPPAAVPAALLVRAPWWYRWALPAAVGVALAGLALTLPFLTVGESWDGPLSLKSGSSIELTPDQRMTVSLPRSQGVSLLEGPIQIRFHRLARGLVSGRTLAELDLSYGKLTMNASHSGPKLIQIHTPFLQVRVTGTKLFVEHLPGVGSRVGVMEGKVWVKPSLPGALWEPLTEGRALVVKPDGIVTQRPLEEVMSAGRPEPLGAVRPEPVEGRTDAQQGGPTEGSGSATEAGSGSDPLRFLWHEQE